MPVDQKQHLLNKIEYEKIIKKYPYDYYLNNYYLNPQKSEIDKLNRAAYFLSLENKDILLDVGCSMGFFISNLCPSVKFAIGVDYELNSLLIAKKYLEASNIKNVFFVQADAVALPFKEEVFTKIVNVDFMEHIIPENQGKVVLEFNRILKRGGLIFTYTPNLIRLKLEYYINKLKYALKGRHYGWQADRPYKDCPDLKNHQDIVLHVGLLNFYSLKKIFSHKKLILKTLFYDELSIPIFSRFIKKTGLFLLRNQFFYSIFGANIAVGFEKK